MSTVYRLRHAGGGLSHRWENLPLRRVISAAWRMGGGAGDEIINRDGHVVATLTKDNAPGRNRGRRGKAPASSRQRAGDDATRGRGASTGS